MELTAVNKTSRTQEEILDKIKEVQPNDWLNFEWPYYLSYLTYENAKEFLKDEVKKEDWKPEKHTPKEKMIDYMPFAKMKAEDERGMSAGRSICHYQAWLWLDGNDTLSKEIENYSGYGIPQLKKICEYLGINYDEQEYKG